MKLANTTRLAIQTTDLGRGGRTNRRSVRALNAHAFGVTKSSKRLVARWHLCPETNRLECAWSLEPGDDQLCRSRFPAARAGRRYRKGRFFKLSASSCH